MKFLALTVLTVVSILFVSELKALSQPKLLNHRRYLKLTIDNVFTGELSTWSVTFSKILVSTPLSLSFFCVKNTVI